MFVIASWMLWYKIHANKKTKNLWFIAFPSSFFWAQEIVIFRKGSDARRKWGSTIGFQRSLRHGGRHGRPWWGPRSATFAARWDEDAMKEPKAGPGAWRSQMRSMVLVYLPTKLGDLWGKRWQIFQHHGAYGYELMFVAEFPTSDHRLAVINITRIEPPNSDSSTIVQRQLNIFNTGVTYRPLCRRPLRQWHVLPDEVWKPGTGELKQVMPCHTGWLVATGWMVWYSLLYLLKFIGCLVCLVCLVGGCFVIICKGSFWFFLLAVWLSFKDSRLKMDGHTQIQRINTSHFNEFQWID